MKARICSMTFIILILCGGLSACGRPSSDEDRDRPQRVLPPATEKLCNQLYGKNKRGKRISWKGNVPVSFSFDDSFPQEFIPAVKAAMDTWNKAASFELFRVHANSRNVIYFLKNDPRVSMEDGGLAVTVINGHANQIVNADIIFNAANTFSTSQVHVNSFDVESVALHELGHSLGLAHNDDPSSTMYYGESSLSFSSRTLDATTKLMLDCEYK